MTGSNILYHYDDFTEEAYWEICKQISNRFSILTYENVIKNELRGERQIVIRHDIDFSPNRALRIACIEAECNIRSIFFILFDSFFYNFFESNILNIIRNIIDLGHDVGIHFNCDPYGGIPSKDDIEKDLIFFRNAMEKYLDYTPTVFAFHNPTEKSISLNNETYYSGMINAYSECFMKRVDYCSDSNGYWRHERLKYFLQKDEIRTACILTHPGWWTPEAMSPWDRIQRAIDGRAVFERNEYLKGFEGSNRINIGKDV